MNWLLKLLFGAAVIGGTLTGLAFTRQLEGALPAPATATLQGKLVGQYNVLVIGVDDLKTESPLLVSAWLAVYRADDGQLDFLPVYPVHPAMGLSEFEAPHSPVAWLGSPKLIPLISAQNLHWDEVVVLDRDTLADFLRLIQSSASTHAADAGLFLQPSLNPWEAPAASRFIQSSLIQFLCEQQPALATSAGFRTALAKMPDHLTSSLSPANFQNAWNTLSNDSKLSCNFPLSEE